MTEQMLSVPTPDGDMGAYVRRPDGDGPFPVIVYFHHGPGLDDGSKQSMQLLADAGYYVVSPDRYHREEPWLVFDIKTLRGGGPEGEKAMQRMFGILMATTDDMVETDLTALLAVLEREPTARKAPMGVIGFCIGARSVMRTLAAHPDIFTAGVALHPSFCMTDDADSPHLVVTGYDGLLYVGFGSEDQMQPATQQQAAHRRGRTREWTVGASLRSTTAPTTASRFPGLRITTLRPTVPTRRRSRSSGRQWPDGSRDGAGHQDAG